MAEEIKRLDVRIKDNGHEYHLLRRSEKVALYKQFHVPSGLCVGYELFEVPVRPLENISGVVYPKRETYPNSSSWGKTSWTLSCNLSDEKAIERFEKLDKEFSDVR